MYLYVYSYRNGYGDPVYGVALRETRAASLDDVIHGPALLRCGGLEVEPSATWYASGISDLYAELNGFEPEYCDEYLDP